MNLIEQEVSQRTVDRDPRRRARMYLSIWRPSPLISADAVGKSAGHSGARSISNTRAVSPPGSHKPNTAVPQAYYNKVFGIERMTTETGAGQWGSALAFACAQFGLNCKVLHGSHEL
jgi:tryptophan synthase beta chain